jgi:hypothetical protein
MLRPAPPQDQPPTPTTDPFEDDDEALLGPCTCGQAPRCLPTCARAGGADRSLRSRSADKPFGLVGTAAA